jgi:glycosyltransferase involved in cell wall biosynthesis
MAAELGVADRVEIGPIPSRDRRGMACLLSQAALVTLLSDYESQGIAVHEALSLRRPVLVAYTSALCELADRSMVSAVSQHASDDEVANAIIRQLRHPRLPPAVRLPTWDECASSLLALYHSIAGRPVRELAS